MAYVLFLLFGVFVELFAQCIAGRHAECIAFEETLDALCIGFVFGMHLLIEQLTGEVSQQYGIGAHAGFYLIEQMDARIVGIGLETSGYRRDVYQVIRLVDEQFGVHDTVVLARFYHVELRAVAQQGAQVRPVAHAVFAVETVAEFDLLAAFFGNAVYVFVVPRAHGKSQSVAHESPRGHGCQSVFGEEFG